ncbi:lasso peptide biosynthesis B2 protein [Lentisphaera profundi]|uniref:Lasso peptide biosynthesis B2 protein n=1 Tax=Lentisphaera profundi TaxID=1658616 RepID=A0ABY7W068_9BACT|nr:lasso peptide biosynthesis B2 protein [Lentisphaera profundi]WDE98830.1 lasso peptide biosynthesis B2 protein [Lentisphaera profundi]
MLRSLLTFIKLPMKIKLLALEVFLELCLACMQLKSQEFKTLAGKFGEKESESSKASREISPEIKMTKRLIFRIAELLPWKCVCFPQAIAGHRILNKKNLSSTLYLGLLKEKGEMKAHAWLRHHQYIVTGDNGIEQYTVINSFTHEPHDA